MPQPKALPPLTDAQRATVAKNLGLVDYVLNLQRVPEYDYADRYQDGVFGLMRAVQLHDPAKAKLSTYAVPWIRQSVQRGRGTERGSGYRRAWESGSEFAEPLSLDMPINEETNQMYGGVITAGDTIEDPGSAEQFDIVELVSSLRLSAEEVALMVLPIGDLRTRLGMTDSDVYRRRAVVRRRYRRTRAA